MKKNINKANNNYIAIIFALLIIILILIFTLIYRKINYDKKKKKNNRKLIINKEMPRQISFINLNEQDISECWENFFSFDKSESDNENILLRPKNINKPELIYVLKNKNYKTIENLSKKLNIKIKNSFDNENLKYLIDDIMENKNKNILICWDYKNIPVIVEEIIKKIYTHQTCDMADDDKILAWGYNPYNKIPDSNDFSTIWVLNFLDNKLTLTSYKGVYLKDDKTCNYNLAGNNFQYQKFPCQNYFQIEYFNAEK